MLHENYPQEIHGKIVEEAETKFSNSFRFACVNCKLHIDVIEIEA